MGRFARDLGLATRALLRQPAFSLVAIVTLALGVGATTAIFSVVSGVLLKPLPYEQSDRIVALGQTSRSAPTEPVDGSSSHLNFVDWKRASETVPLMALYSGGQAIISGPRDADVVRVGTVTPDFFAVFRAHPIVGREFTGDESRAGGPRAVIVSHGFWQERLGGRADVLESTVEVSGSPWPIVGVAPPAFDFPAGARLWFPVRNDEEQCGRGCVYLNGIGRLADGVTAEAAQQELTTIAATLEREYPAANTDTTVMVQLLHDRTVGDVRLGLGVLFAAVTMVLLIACANVANLMLVRGAARQGELAVRIALGARPGRLVSYLLTESLLIAVAGGAAGVVIAAWGVEALKALAPVNIPRLEHVGFDVATLVFALAVVGATIVLFGLGPAVQLSRVSPARLLGRHGTAGVPRTRWTKTTLLAAEVALSLVLLLGAGLLVRSLWSLQATDLGFEAENRTVFMVHLPPTRYPAAVVVAAHERLAEQFGAMPGVTGVARVSGLPLGAVENVLTFSRPDKGEPEPGSGSVALYRIADAAYFDLMGIPVLAGRAFDPADRQGAPRVVVISRRMAEVFWPGEDPVGRPIQIDGQQLATVIGVVGDVRSQSLGRPADPEMYVPHAQTDVRSVMYVVKSPLEASQVLGGAREIVRRMDAGLPLISPGSLAALVDDQLGRPRFYVLLLGVFAVLAIVLAAVGVYGVVAYVVAQRTREIGVRMALGARAREVITLMLWQGLRPAVVGLLLGLAAAMAAGRLLAGLLHGVEPHDPGTLAIVTLLLLLVVVAACAIPAWRASAVPPSEVLRNE
jgi:putative ABC transport system permease protein